MKEKLTIVMYHYVRNIQKSRYPGIKGLEYNLFKQQIAYLMKHYNIIRMEELLAYYDNNYELPDNPMLLTFDDGYSDHFNYVYPVLKNWNIQGSFFISGKTISQKEMLDANKIQYILACADNEQLFKELLSQLDIYRNYYYEYPSNEELITKYAVAKRFDCAKTVFIKVILQRALSSMTRRMILDNLFKKYVTPSEDILAKELYLSVDQIKCMRQSGMFIGIHGYEHEWYSNMTEREAKIDLDKSLNVLDGLITPDCFVMNYPYGSYNENVIRYLRKNNCKIGLTTDVGYVNLNEHDRLLLPRLDTNDFPPVSNNFRRI